LPRTHETVPAREHTTWRRRSGFAVTASLFLLGAAACRPSTGPGEQASSEAGTGRTGAVESSGQPVADASGDWTRFRGPNGSGVIDVSGLPTEFGPDTNVVWKTPLPFGHSSPIIVGDRIYVTGSEGDALLTLAVDAERGEIVWQRDAKRAFDAAMYKENDASSPTPASDGENVFVFFSELGLLSYDREGNERWRVELGPFDNFYGMAASPVIAGDLVLLLCDQVEGSFFLALDKNTGEQRWRAERPGRIESYTTPVLYPADVPTSVLVFGSGWIDAYALSDGAHQWEMPGVGEGPVASPVVAGSMMVVTTPNHVEEPFPTFEALLATADTDGDERMSATEFSVVPGFGEHFGWTDRDSDGLLTAEEYEALVAMAEGSTYGVIGISLPDDGSSRAGQIVWTHEQSLPYIPTPLVYDGVLYLVRDGGIVQSLDPATGEVFKRGRTSRAAGSVFSSPVAADGKIIIASLEGEIAVLQAGPQWEVMAVSEIDEPIYSSPALADQRVYVRTPTSLYAFGER